MKTWIIGVAAVLTASTAHAHIMVSPPQSKAGAQQKYELRVHNEGKLATTAIDLEIPEGITVLNVAQPTAGTFETTKNGSRITGVTWHVEVAPGKYLALPFTAKNPSAAAEVKWIVHEHLSDGSVVDWTDKAGAKEKASVTTIAAAPKSEP
jgi:uncharacterized protein YcnI